MKVAAICSLLLRHLILSGFGVLDCLGWLIIRNRRFASTISRIKAPHCWASKQKNTGASSCQPRAGAAKRFFSRTICTLRSFTPCDHASALTFSDWIEGLAACCWRTSAVLAALRHSIRCLYAGGQSPRPTWPHRRAVCYLGMQDWISIVAHILLIPNNVVVSVFA